MLRAVRVLGHFAVHVFLRPGENEAAVEWYTPHVWGGGTAVLSAAAAAAGPDDGPDSPFERWADALAEQVAIARGAGRFGAYRNTALALRGALPVPGEDMARARTAFLVKEALTGTDGDLGGESFRVAREVHFLRPRPAFLVPPFLVRGRGKRPLAYPPFCRGVVEGLVELLAAEASALGPHAAVLRATLEGVHRDAADGADLDARIRQHRRAQDDLRLHWRGNAVLSTAPALWYAAVADTLLPLLSGVVAGDEWASPRHSLGLLGRAQALVSRIGLARAVGTEDPEEGLAWAEERLAEGFATQAPRGVRPNPGGLGAFLAGRGPA